MWGDCDGVFFLLVLFQCPNLTLLVLRLFLNLDAEIDRVIDVDTAKKWFISSKLAGFFCLAD